MDRFDRIPEVTEHVLDGLKADDALKHRILLAASSRSSEPKRNYSFRTVVALCSLSVLLILLCVFAISANTRKTADIQVIPAGSRHSTPPVSLETVIEKAAEQNLP